MGLTGRGIGVAGEPGRRDLRESGEHADVSLRWSTVPTRGATWSSDGGSSLLMMNTGFGSAFPVSSNTGPACEWLKTSSRHGSCSRAGNRTLLSLIPYSAPVTVSISSTASRGKDSGLSSAPFPNGAISHRRIPAILLCTCRANGPRAFSLTSSSDEFGKRSQRQGTLHNLWQRRAMAEARMVRATPWSLWEMESSWGGARRTVNASSNPHGQA